MIVEVKATLTPFKIFHMNRRIVTVGTCCLRGRLSKQFFDYLFN
jgi:hypothetical protein